MSTLVGKKAPKFSATAVIDGKSIVRNYGIDQFIGKKYVLFFTPKIFLEYVLLNYMIFRIESINSNQKMLK